MIIAIVWLSRSDSLKLIFPNLNVDIPLNTMSKKYFVKSLIFAIPVFFLIENPNYSHASTNFLLKPFEPVYQSAMERSRQKRNIAIKDLEKKGFVKVETDDSGNQYLNLPWIPDRRVPYKSLSLQQRLQNEVCAGAFGEICKDLLLHPVDTLKTRRQVKKNLKQTSSEDKQDNQSMGLSNISLSITYNEINFISILSSFKNLYSGFPIVAMSSIPQGGIFFLFKKGIIETISMTSPACPDFIKSIIAISVGVMGYWGFRTPAEIIKTQVQTGQAATVQESLQTILEDNNGNYNTLWKYYPVMLCLDIPFQVMNLILYGLLSDTFIQMGLQPSTWTRLVCGVVCGMFCAGVTCPIDVCKTRIISRDKENAKLLKLARLTLPIIHPVTIPSISLNENMEFRETIANALADISNATLAEDVTLSHGSSNSLHSLSNSTRITTLASDGRPGHANANVVKEMMQIFREEGFSTLFLGLRQRLLYTGLANGIRLAAYGTSRMDLMMRSLDDI
jgi:hypothetical protein